MFVSRSCFSFGLSFSSTLNCQLLTVDSFIAAGIPARPAPAPLRRQDPLGCADHRALPAIIAGCTVASQGFRPLSVRLVHQEIAAPHDPAPLSDPRKNPCPVKKPGQYVLRAPCCPQEPANSS